MDPAPIMRLALELRQQIYNYLLPDLPVIETPKLLYQSKYGHEPNWQTEWNLHGRLMYEWSDLRVPLRYDRQHCSTAILSVNRQLYEEASSYLYHRKFVFSVSPFYISFLRNRYQDIHSEARDYQGIRHVDLSDFNWSFPIGKVKEIYVRLDMPAATTSIGRWSQWSITDVGRQMSLLCELLNKLRRPEELLPKTSLKLPTSVVRAQSADERHQLDGDQPACIEAALQAMSKTLRRIRSCEVTDLRCSCEDYPQIQGFG